MHSRELQSLGIPLDAMSSSSINRTLRSATHTREMAPPASCIATRVLQCTDLRLLIQSFTVYEESSIGADSSALHGGWKLAHLCKLNFHHRLALVGDLRCWSVFELERYCQKRVDYILRYRHAAPGASFKERQKLICDVPQIVVQLHRWLKLHKESIKEANDDTYYQSLEAVLEWANELFKVIDGRRGMEIATEKQLVNVGILYQLRSQINANILKKKCDRAKSKFDLSWNDTVGWLNKLVKGEVSFFLFLFSYHVQWGDANTCVCVFSILSV